jgi:ABC-2 type transport system permease protein
MQPDRDLVAGSATGSIYDIGYRRYDGPRLGRAHAFRVLFGRSLRWTYGIGRPGSAKVVPFGLAAFTFMPAIVIVGISGFFGARLRGFEGAGQLGASGFMNMVGTLLVFFVIAQGPELLGRDQRFGTLTLYFSRSLGRTDYALAKFLALTTALALMVLAPMVLILVGTLFTSTDLAAGLGEVLPKVLPALASTFGAAALLSSIALAIAAFTPRRAYAAGAIAAVLLILGGIADVLVVRSGRVGSGSFAGVLQWAGLLDANALVDGLN